MAASPSAYLDFLDATIFFGVYRGAAFTTIWHGVSSGLLGREAADAGGWNTAILGIILHFIVASLIALTYYLVSNRIPFMIAHPVISGIVFGLAAFFVMNYIVIPLSAIGGVGAFRLSLFLNGVIGHALLVGLPVALIARWSALKDQNANH